MVAAAHVGKVPPSIPSIRDTLVASLSQAGWLLSLVNMTAAIGGMSIALTVDRFGHRRLVVLGTALCCVASLLGAVAGSIDLLLVWRFHALTNRGYLPALAAAEYLFPHCQ